MELATVKLLSAHAVIAVFGAIVHAANSYRNGTSKTWMDFFTLTIMASFSGVMFALLALYLFPTGGYLTLAIAGTGGFLGVEGMTIIAAKIRTLIANK